MKTYISIDIETDGPLIGTNSMLSLGAAAFSFDVNQGLEPISTFEVNLEPLLNSIPDPQTIEEFWSKHPKAWEIATTNQKEPSEAINLFIKWYNSIEGEKIIAAYPAAFDFAWLRHYVISLTGKDTLRHEALDIKSLASAALKKPFNEVKTSRMPDNWRYKKARVSHRAVDDAITQGILLMHILYELDIRQ